MHMGLYTCNVGKFHPFPNGQGGYFVEELPPGAKPLPRPSPRTVGLRQLTNDELRRIAAMNPPPVVWFDEDQEIPF